MTAAERAAAERAEQGLSRRVEDAAVLAQVATLLASPSLAAPASEGGDHGDA